MFRFMWIDHPCRCVCQFAGEPTTCDGHAPPVRREDAVRRPRTYDAVEVIRKGLHLFQPARTPSLSSPAISAIRVRHTLGAHLSRDASGVYGRPVSTERRTRRAPQIIGFVRSSAVVLLHDPLPREHAQVQRAPSPVHDCVLQGGHRSSKISVGRAKSTFLARAHVVVRPGPLAVVRVAVVPGVRRDSRNCDNRMSLRPRGFAGAISATSSRPRNSTHILAESRRVRAPSRLL